MIGYFKKFREGRPPPVKDPQAASDHLLDDQHMNPPLTIPKRPAEWFHVPDAHPCGVALVLHGLNMNPVNMDHIAQFLAFNGIECYRPTLTGHDGNLEALKGVKRRVFLDDVTEAYQVAAERAQSLGTPLFLVGFSMGSLLANDVINDLAEKVFDRMVLFAPALAFHPASLIFRLLKPLSDLKVPSSFPEFYRASIEGMPVGVYNALLDSAVALKKKKFFKSNVPTLIFFDPRDRLASYRGLKKIQKQFRMTNWKFIPVNCNTDINHGHFHFITEPSVMGESQWTQMQKQIVHFLVDAQKDASPHKEN